MYYRNRIDLGSKLSVQLESLKGQEAVILSLKESSMTACIALASQINAWIFPLLTVPIAIPNDPRTIGVLTEDGVFVWNPDFSPSQRDDIEMNFRPLLEQAKREAHSKVNALSTQYGEYQKAALNGRSVIILGDIVRDKIEIAAALEFLKSVRYAKLYAVGGNVDAHAADYMHLQADSDVELDVMTNMFDDGHYFDEQDSYTVDECRQLLINISQYWV